MGLLTWIVIIVIILAVSGVMRGADIVWNSPAVQNVTQEVEEFVQNNTGEEAGR